MNQTILFRLNADPATGYGHLYRCMALELALSGLGYGFAYLVNHDGSGVSEKIMGGGRRVARLLKDATPSDEVACLEGLADELKPVGIVVDLLHSQEDFMEAAGRCCSVVLAIDDVYGNNRNAHIVVNAGLGADRARYANMKAELLLGPEYLLIRPQYAIRREAAPAKDPSRVFISFGGSDPHKITPRVIDALNMVEHAGLKATVAVGNGYGDLKGLSARLDLAGYPFELLSGVDDLSLEMAESALAVCSVGNTAWELACVGTPSILVTFFEGQERFADGLAREGMAIYFSRSPEFNGAELARLVEGLLKDPARLSVMASSALRVVDGLGAKRVAEILHLAVRERMRRIASHGSAEPVQSLPRGSP
ncbi:MAG: hypothetical protein HY751_02840 [Nitrospinae bacterium]|nr:hypothetical protein [Nitrospinota bacterium]